ETPGHPSIGSSNMMGVLVILVIPPGERLRWLEGDEMLIYQRPKPRHDGQTLLRLTPMEFLDRVAILIPPPQRHRHRYHGVLAPNAPLRKQVTERAGLPVTDERVVSGEKRTVTEEGGEPEPALATGCMMTSIWSMLLARIYEINPLVCSRCGGEMRIIALTYSVRFVRA
ncbi:MAG: transposase, partial [Sedimenticola sp.]